MNSRLCSGLQISGSYESCHSPADGARPKTKNKSILFEAQRTMASLQHRTLS